MPRIMSLKERQLSRLILTGVTVMSLVTLVRVGSSHNFTLHRRTREASGTQQGNHHTPDDGTGRKSIDRLNNYILGGDASTRERVCVCVTSYSSSRGKRQVGHRGQTNRHTVLTNFYDLYFAKRCSIVNYFNQQPTSPNNSTTTQFYLPF